MDHFRGGFLSRVLDEIYGETVLVLRILCVALCIFFKHWNLSLPVLAAVLLPSSLLSLSQLLLFDPASPLYRPRPLQSNLLLVLRNSKNGGSSDKNILVVADFGFLLAHCALDLFEATATVFVASAVHRDPRPSLRDLLRRIRREGTGPAVTLLYVAILRTGYGVLLELFTDALLPVMAGPTGLLLTAVSALLGISGSLFLYYLDAAWASGTAAAAVDNCGGLRAVALAAETTARRRRVAGIILLLIFQAISETTTWVMDLAVGLASPGALQVSIFLLFGNSSELLHMLKLAALTVYYWRCRRSRQAEEEGGSYSRLAASPSR